MAREADPLIMGAYRIAEPPLMSNRGPTFHQVPDRGYEDGVKDALTWLLLNRQNYKPEYLAEEMARDLLPEKTDEY